jgi:SAM-dependent methyltransferase
MTDTLDAIQEHYRVSGLTDRLRSALAAFGPEDRVLTPQQLAPLDQFHSRGLAATAELSQLAGITDRASVLDVGAGIGGPARFLAATCGCTVAGVDLNPEFVEAARYLTRRTGLERQVSFATASALDLPFDNGRFDLALLQHVAMNIADRQRLYSEIGRVLKPHGRFVTYDIVARAGDPHFPLPWARKPEASYLLTAEATRAAVEGAGFRLLTSADDTGPATAWIAKLRESGPPPAPNLGMVVGPDFGQLVANLGRSLMEGRVGVLTAMFERIA